MKFKIVRLPEFLLIISDVVYIKVAKDNRNPMKKMSFKNSTGPITIVFGDSKYSTPLNRTKNTP